ncbi:CoA-binding protein [Palleronia sp.]|uniref:CoA-binding protein n=1 Tax=Palleronia sp. TaxID=1940284 RepID=UPI0035C7F1CC
MTDDDIRRILTDVNRIALVGASANPARPSNGVGQFLAARGYEVHPVNPGLAGQSLFGRTVVARLPDLSDDIEMLDIFRRSDAVPAVVEEALDVMPSLRVVWMQLGVVSPEAAAMAEANGVEVVMDRCPKIDIPRLGIERRAT